MKYQCYMITNKLNSMRYIGMTRKPFRERFNDHFTEARQEARSGESASILHIDMIKFGEENFSAELVEDDISLEDHQERERYWIAFYHTYYSEGGYNMTFGGNGTAGYIFTDEVKSKMSSIRKGKTFSEERNARLKELMTGREYKEEWKRALSESRKGRFTKEENPFYGKHHSEETKQKLRESRYIGDVLQIDNSGYVINRFSGFLEAGKFVSESGISSAKPSTCGTRIREVARSENSKCTAYRFHWRLEERSID